jgi:hypothetical protein
VFYYKNHPNGFAVKVQKPTLNLRQLLQLWKRPADDALALKSAESFNSLKLVYIALQVLTEVRTKLVRKGIQHNCMTLDSFDFSKHEFSVTLEHFAFASRADVLTRGGVLGFNNDRECLIVILLELSNFQNVSAASKSAITSAIQRMPILTNETISDAISVLSQFLANNLDKLISILTREEKQQCAFDLLMKILNLKSRNPFSLRILEAEDKHLSLIDLEKAS